MVLDFIRSFNKGQNELDIVLDPHTQIERGNKPEQTETNTGRPCGQQKKRSHHPPPLSSKLHLSII